MVTSLVHLLPAGVTVMVASAGPAKNVPADHSFLPPGPRLPYSSVRSAGQGRQPVTAHLELRPAGGGGTRIVVLDKDRLTIGRDADNDVALPDDPRLSRVHAAFERYGTGWSINDLGSRNGTFVNNQRLWRERILRGGDEIKAGTTLLVYRTEPPAAEPDPTEGGTGIMRVTPREYEVLAALCSPLVDGELFTEPASTRDIAEVLVITEAAVKQHLLHLYDKFGIHDPAERRRARLANEAFRRGLLNQADLRAWRERQRPRRT
jgi:DNA-binding CsgD family transcriptional regulator